jgi:putative tryptophan/tyrosine transport system substrate-binding protein
MKRREFVTLLGGTAAWPLTVHAQQPAMPLVGFLNVESLEAYGPMAAAFRRGLKESGYVEGQNVAIEYRWAEGRGDRLAAMAADLVRRQVTVIAATTTAAALAAKAATTVIPIVFEIGGDPVGLGLTPSLSRPSGNITGVTQLSAGLVSKQLEVLREMLPTARVIAFLVNPANPAIADVETSEALSAARTLGLELHVLNASTEADFDGIFARLTELGVSGLVIGADPLFSGRSEQLGKLTARRAVPAVSKGREFAAAGGLISYGASTTDAYRLAGVYAGQVLRGAKPADLPVQQATKIELYINLKTAKALSLTVPLPLSGRADEVFE